MRNQTKSLLQCIAIVGLLAACGGPNTAKISTSGNPNGGGPNSTIQKGTEAKAPLSDDDQFAVALGEFEWSRFNFTSVANPGLNDRMEGCVQYRVSPRLARTLVTTYNCSRASDETDSALNRRVETTGTFFHYRNLIAARVEGAMNINVYAADNSKLAASQFSRSLEITFPAASGQASTYNVKASTDVTSAVAAESARLGEEWHTELNGGLDYSTQNPVASVIAGSDLKLRYVAESAPPAKTAERKVQVIELYAKTDISFVRNGSCLRPVGTFDWTLGEGSGQRKGTITATASGFVRQDASIATPATLRPWGPHCLER